MKKSNLKQDKNNAEHNLSLEHLKDFGISEDFFNKPITEAHRLVYSLLQNMIERDYKDPYENGPEKMARYVDSFFQFIAKEYPEDKDSNKRSLKSLITNSISITLPDKTKILYSYNMQTQTTDYQIFNSKNSILELSIEHLKIVKSLSGNLQEEIFKTITMLISSMPPKARDKMEEKYLKPVRN